MGKKQKTKGNIRNLLTILGISIGVASVILTSIISDIGNQLITEEIDQFSLGSIMISNDKNVSGRAMLGDKELDLLRSSDSTSWAIPIVTNYCQASMRGLIAKVALWGIHTADNQVISVNKVHGRMLSEEDIQMAQRVCVVDESMARDYYNRSNIVGKELSISIDGISEMFTIVGVVQSGGTLMQSMLSAYVPYLAYIPSTTMQQITGKTDFNQIAIQVDSEENADAIGEQLVKMLSIANHVDSGYYVDNIRDQREQLDHVLQIVQIVLSGIAGISLIVSGLSIMTVMLMRVKERTREIGIKKSIGAKKSDILVEFLTDALQLTSMGGIIGCTISVLPMQFLIWILGLEYQIQYVTVLQVIVFSLVIGLSFGVYPALSAARLHPVQALQQE